MKIRIAIFLCLFFSVLGYGQTTVDSVDVEPLSGIDSTAVTNTTWMPIQFVRNDSSLWGKFRVSDLYDYFLPWKIPNLAGFDGQVLAYEAGNDSLIWVTKTNITDSLVVSGDTLFHYKKNGATVVSTDTLTGLVVGLSISKSNDTTTIISTSGDTLQIIDYSLKAQLEAGKDVNIDADTAAALTIDNLTTLTLRASDGTNAQRILLNPAADLISLLNGAGANLRLDSIQAKIQYGLHEVIADTGGVTIKTEDFAGASSGQVLMLGANGRVTYESVNIANGILYVGPGGVDSSAIAGSLDSKWATIDGAISYANQQNGGAYVIQVLYSDTIEQGFNLGTDISATSPDIILNFVPNSFLTGPVTPYRTVTGGSFKTTINGNPSFLIVTSSNTVWPRGTERNEWNFGDVFLQSGVPLGNYSRGRLDVNIQNLIGIDNLTFRLWSQVQDGGGSQYVTGLDSMIYDGTTKYYFRDSTLERYAPHTYNIENIESDMSYQVTTYLEPFVIYNRLNDVTYNIGRVNFTGTGARLFGFIADRSNTYHTAGRIKINVESIYDTSSTYNASVNDNSFFGFNVAKLGNYAGEIDINVGNIFSRNSHLFGTISLAGVDEFTFDDPGTTGKGSVSIKLGTVQLVNGTNKPRAALDNGSTMIFECDYCINNSGPALDLSEITVSDSSLLIIRGTFETRDSTAAAIANIPVANNGGKIIFQGVTALAPTNTQTVISADNGAQVYASAVYSYGPIDSTDLTITYNYAGGSGGGSGTDDQTLSIDSTATTYELSIEDGNTVSIAKGFVDSSGTDFDLRSLIPLVQQDTFGNNSNISINLQSRYSADMTIDLSNKSGTVNFNLPTNPQSGGSYLFYLINPSSTVIDFNANILQEDRSTAFDSGSTITYTTPTIIWCKYDSTTSRFYCK